MSPKTRLEASLVNATKRPSAERTGLTLGPFASEPSEPTLTRYDLFNADECFITGTAAEIVPVVKIDGRVIGDGQPGQMTRMLEDRYHALTKVSGEPIYA